jgi:starch phosphorylase
MLGNDPSALQQSMAWHLRYSLGKNWSERNNRDLFRCLSLAVRDRLMERLLATEGRYQVQEVKRLYYLSIEFLIGRSLENNLYNLGIYQGCQAAFRELGADLGEILEMENDAALGNGGLGRLAACFLDSLATLGMPGFGYGIKYEFGLFRQEIDNGYQREKPEQWKAEAAPCQIERVEEACLIPLYGRIVHEYDLNGEYNPMWMDWQVIIGVPFDIPIAGYGGETVNYLRLFEARPSSEFDIQIFNEGDYFQAVQQKINSENISKILYPSDLVEPGRELRLIQEYFLVACALKDIVRHFLKRHQDFQEFPHKVAVQLNDTHPALAVAELMRILVDERAQPWDEAWSITQRTMAYTNHTLLPEALEKWPARLLEQVLPRHLQIIYEINRRFLDQVMEIHPEGLKRLEHLSLVEEGPEKQICMARLAMVGSHSVNGVSELHTRLLKEKVFPDFYRLWPRKFNNKTNGVTPRRWLLIANPGLAALLGRTIGEGWITDADRLRDLEALAEDASFQEEFLAVKRANKERLGKLIWETTRVRVSPSSLYDIQAKRIHEYKRQLLKVMHIIYEYLTLVEDGRQPLVPRTYVFAGKAAPGYWVAKQLIKLIHSVGEVIDKDARCHDFMKVAFIPDYKVSLAEKIIPAADLSEQISTAGKEASGTGNMKFALNGALTIGTLDGANIEIQEAVGERNIFIFGLSAAEINRMRSAHSYHPGDWCRRHPEIQRVIEALHSSLFCPGEPGLFQWICRRLLDEGDEYFHLADFMPYLQAQEEAGHEYHSPTLWARKAILNVARMGKFSSDRTISEYAQEIWELEAAR